jgi:hypothetical protein
MIPIFFFSSLSENLLTKLGPLLFTHAKTIHNLKALLDSIQLMTQEVYHIHTGRKKREFFAYPFFPRSKQASKHIAVPYYWVASRRGRRRKAVQGYLVPVGLAEDWAPFMEERSAATVTFVNLLGVVLSSSHCWWQRWILFSYLLEIPE